MLYCKTCLCKQTTTTKWNDSLLGGATAQTILWLFSHLLISHYYKLPNSCQGWWVKHEARPLYEHQRALFHFTEKETSSSCHIHKMAVCNCIIFPWASHETHIYRIWHTRCATRWAMPYGKHSELALCRIWAQFLQMLFPGGIKMTVIMVLSSWKCAVITWWKSVTPQSETCICELGW